MSRATLTVTPGLPSRLSHAWQLRHRKGSRQVSNVAWETLILQFMSRVRAYGTSNIDGLTWASSHAWASSRGKSMSRVTLTVSPGLPSRQSHAWQLRDRNGSRQVSNVSWETLTLQLMSRVRAYVTSNTHSLARSAVTPSPCLTTTWPEWLPAGVKCVVRDTNATAYVTSKSVRHE